MREPIAGATATVALVFFPLFALAAPSEATTMGGIAQLGYATYNLNVLVFWACVAIAHVLFGLMIYSIATARVEEAQFRHSARAEVIWTMIPILILVAMALPSVQEVIGTGQSGSAIVMKDESGDRGH